MIRNHKAKKVVKGARGNVFESCILKAAKGETNGCRPSMKLRVGNSHTNAGKTYDVVKVKGELVLAPRPRA